MVSIQSSSYGMSALVSSQMPSATKNGDANPAPAKLSESQKVDGTRPAGGPPPGESAPDGPPPRAVGVDKSSDDTRTLLTLHEPDEMEEMEPTSSEDFEAAARFLLESIDLREEDDAEFAASQESGVSFDEAGTYRPAWIK